eukprot:scaffold18297_cov50-Phaeocystis_antarctica.AAC.1
MVVHIHVLLLAAECRVASREPTAAVVIGAELTLHAPRLRTAFRADKRAVRLASEAGRNVPCVHVPVRFLVGRSKEPAAAVVLGAKLALHAPLLRVAFRADELAVRLASGAGRVDEGVPIIHVHVSPVLAQAVGRDVVSASFVPVVLHLDCGSLNHLLLPLPV